MQERVRKKPPGRYDLRTEQRKEGREFPRKFGGAKLPVPFPQKPPYRPGGEKGVSARPAKYPLRSGTARPNAKFERPKPPRTQLAKYTPRPAQGGKPASTSWGGVATWYDKHLASTDTYHEKVILPNLMRLVDPQKGEAILDLACGEGFFARAFAAKGATVSGLDISPELIALAQKKPVSEITYNVGSADNLSRFTNEQFHKAVIVLAIQNIEYAQKVFTEAARVVKKDGALHIVMNHPAFRIPKQSNWGYDEKSGVQFRRVDQYISESRTAIDMHPGMKDSPQTVSFHRPFQYYMKALVKVGFVIDRFEEWISHKESDSGPRAKAENRARKEIPLFLYIRARKL